MSDLTNPVVDNSANQPVPNESATSNGTPSNNQPVPPPVASWRDALPPDIKDAKTWEKFKDINDVFKSYLNLEKTLGNKRLSVPTKESTQEDWDNVYNELGRPKTPLEYNVPKIDGVPDGLIDANRLNGFKEIAHKSGLNNAQFEQLISAFIEGELNTYKQYNKMLDDQRNEGIAKLRAEQGANYDKYMMDVQRTIDTFGSSSPEFIEYAKNNGLMDNPAFIKFMGGIAKQVTSSSVTNAVNNIVTQQEAVNELNKILGDATHPFYKQEHSQHKQAVERYNYLSKIAYSR